MKRDQIAAHATITFLMLVPAGCELVLGELPTAKEDLTTTESTAPTGGGGATTATGAGGLGGAGGAPTTAGSGGGSSSSTSDGGGGTTTSSSTSSGVCCETVCCDACDCDCDGALTDACAGTGTPDCDDTNNQVKPGQTKYFVEPSPNNGFDWDCNGLPERDPLLATPVDCASLLGIGCNQKVGFLGKTAPACGEAGTWGTCKKVNLECLPDPIEIGKKMACK